MILVEMDIENKLDYDEKAEAIRTISRNECAKAGRRPTDDYLQCMVDNVSRYGFGYVHCTEEEWKKAFWEPRRLRIMNEARDGVG